MEFQETLIKRYGDGLNEVVADNVHGEPSMSPEDILIMREDLEATRIAARSASQTEETESR